MNQQVHAYKYLQSHIAVIIQQHVSVSLMAIISVFYNKNQSIYR